MIPNIAFRDALDICRHVNFKHDELAESFGYKNLFLFLIDAARTKEEAHAAFLLCPVHSAERKTAMKKIEELSR